MAPELGKLAARMLQRVLVAVRSQLIVELTPGRGFVRVGEDADAAAAASMVSRRLSHKLHQQARVWADTLSAEVCAPLLAEAIEGLATELTRTVFELRHGIANIALCSLRQSRFPYILQKISFIILQGTLGIL